MDASASLALIYLRHQRVQALARAQRDEECLIVRSCVAYCGLWSIAPAMGGMQQNLEASSNHEQKESSLGHTRAT